MTLTPDLPRPLAFQENGASDDILPLGRVDTDLYGPLGAWMAGVGVGGQALKAGDEVPNFILPDEQARLVSLQSLLAEGPVILSFVAGSWCGFCVGRIKALCAAVQGSPVKCVAITPETGSYPQRMKTENQLDCIVLSDVDYGVGLAFGLTYMVPPPIITQMAERGLDLTAVHGATSPMFSAPAVYVIDSSGKIVMSRVDLNYLTGLDVGQVLTALPTDA